MFLLLIFSTTYADDTPIAAARNGRFSCPPPNNRSISNNNIVVNTTKPASIVRSYSQDINMSAPDLLASKQKNSQSDSSLDNQNKPRPIRQKTIKEQPSVSIEEDLCSTDSSVVDEDIKKKKKKLFPGFSKKNKIKD